MGVRAVFNLQKTMTLAAVVFLVPTSLCAGDIEVSSAVALDGIVKCHARIDWWVTVATGPCKEFTPPTNLAVGERFVAEGKSWPIGIIVAMQAEEDMSDLDLKKGEWMCVAAEDRDNLPSDENQDGDIVWLSIPKCQPNLETR
jgi:hypothetical protein